ncbi:leucine-rich repeat domain-containing protein [Paenibacillus sp. GCM10027629]|uniref:leucine-rich repeat domain-containing protein n=1 Tax=Paenibacillus sp. GCM10027629 TaxID=3273414 RepID=UPI0036D360E2
MERLTSMDASGRGISDLSGIEYATRLQSLNLADNSIRDVSKLGALSGLETLILNQNEIAEWNALGNIARLKSLWLTGNQITELTGIGSLTQLESLYLANNQIGSLSGLEHLLQLKELNLAGNQIHDLVAIQMLTQLQSLNIEENQVTSISGLSVLKQLEWLSLAFNRIKDLTPISELSQLQYLDVRGAAISDESNQVLKKLQNQGGIVEYSINNPPADSTLTGPEQVTPGQTFDITMGLSDVTQSVYQEMYAQDLTLHYDPAKLQFESVASLKDGFQVIDKKESVPGQIRVVAASVKTDQGVLGVPAQGNLLSFKFKAKSGDQATNTVVSVDNVVIANGQGNELSINGSSSEIQISISVDKSQLITLIASAQAKHNAAVEGEEDGLYVVGSKAQLQSAIDAARATANDPNATQQQVDDAKAALDAAIQVFDTKKVTADVNGQGGITIGDLAIVAGAYGKQEGQAGWNAKADVNKDGKVDVVDLAIVAKAILQKTMPHFSNS